MIRKKRVFIVVLAIALLASAWWQFGPRTPAPWSASDIVTLRSLSLESLPKLPTALSNAVADDPRAARLGHKLFFDTRLSAIKSISCATCHKPERRFTDGLKKGHGIGQSGRNTRSIVGTAYSPWLYWDGRKDSLWAQALSPLEDPAEHGSNRMHIVRLIATDPEYNAAYEELFGAIPNFSNVDQFPGAAAPNINPTLSAAWNNMSAENQHLVNIAFANIGKAIAAYERLLMPAPSRFDEYVSSLDRSIEGSDSALSNEELLGLQLFIDEARCTECHNGPLFTNHEFHNTGVLSFPGDHPDRGRIDGLKKLLSDPFNCWGNYSDDPSRNCAELEYVRTGVELIGATRTPSLRNLSGTAPYSHKGQQQTLAEVIDLYNRAPLAMIGHNEAEEKLGLSAREMKQLESFLNSLDAPLATDPKWLKAPQ